MGGYVMKKIKCIKKKKNKAMPFLIIASIIGGGLALMAICLRHKRLSITKKKDPSADMSKKDHDHIVLNDVSQERPYEAGTESKCNSPEWERGPKQF